jgi:hypothetical protein
LVIARTEKGIEEMRESARKSEKDAYAFIERVIKVKREAEQRLRDSGGTQDADGRWWWHTENGDVLLVDDARSDAGDADAR